LSTPEVDRRGPVFKPYRDGKRLSGWTVSRDVSIIGRKAGIKVDTDANGVVKYASAHDLRRSFGERWAQRVMPQVLKELMRHETIETTMKFYVGRNAQTTAAVLWEAHRQAADPQVRSIKPIACAD
jgi:integrase